MNYRVKATGLDSTSIKEKVITTKTNFKYFLTSIESDNDFIISDMIKNSRESEILLYTSVDVCDLEFCLINHLTTLEKNRVAALLLDPRSLEEWKACAPVLRGLKDKGLVGNFGIYCPKTIEDITTARMGLIDEVLFVALPICPLEFNYEVLEKAKEEGLIIVGLNPFGGHINAPRIIDMFTVPYLLGFISTYADIILFSGRNIPASSDYCRLIVTMMGDDVNTKFELKKSIHSLYPDPPKAVNTYLMVAGEKNYVVEYDNPNIVYGLEETKVSLSKLPEIYPEKLESEKEESKIAKEIRDFLEMGERNLTEDNVDLKYTLFRYRILAYLKLMFKDHIFDIIPLGKRTIAISTLHYKKLNWFQKHILGKDPKVEVHKFVFTVFGDGKTLFLEIE